MLHTKLRENQSAGSRGFLYVHGGHLGHVTSIILMDFYFHVISDLHKNFG